MKKDSRSKSEKRLYNLVQAAIIASIYLVATLFTSAFSFGIIQFRISEALAALAILFRSAIPGLFVGCLLSNLLNPGSLGVIDIVFGSLATGIAAILSYYLGKNYRKSLAIYLYSKNKDDAPKMRSRILPLLPPVIINALVIGSYLPFLIQGVEPSLVVVLLSMLSILISQSIAIYALGLPLLLAMENTPIARKEVQDLMLTQN